MGAEKTPSADGQYNVAWKSGSQFKVWITDSNGAYLGEGPTLTDGAPEMPGYENFFHQDFNGDGHVGTLTGATAADNAGAQAGGDATGASVTLLVNYMVTTLTMPAAAVGTNTAEPQPASLQDYLTRPLA